MRDLFKGDTVITGKYKITQNSIKDLLMGHCERVPRDKIASSKWAHQFRHGADLQKYLSGVK